MDDDDDDVLSFTDLKGLEGVHELSGVDDTVEILKVYGKEQERNVILFILDGITYKAVENPDDGYRSYCKNLVICKDKVSTRFPSHLVVGKMKNGNCTIIQFFDIKTNEVGLEIGTDNYDNYYPYCVMNWNPQNLAINR